MNLCSLLTTGKWEKKEKDWKIDHLENLIKLNLNIFSAVFSGCSASQKKLDILGTFSKLNFSIKNNVSVAQNTYEKRKFL